MLGVACVVRRMLHTTGFFQQQSREGIVEGSKGKFHLSSTTSPVSVRYCHNAHSRKTPPKYRQLGMAFWVALELDMARVKPGPGHLKDVNRCAK